MSSSSSSSSSTQPPDGAPSASRRVPLALAYIDVRLADDGNVVHRVPRHVAQKHWPLVVDVMQDTSDGVEVGARDGVPVVTLQGGVRRAHMALLVEYHRRASELAQVYVPRKPDIGALRDAVELPDTYAALFVDSEYVEHFFDTLRTAQYLGDDGATQTMAKVLGHVAYGARESDVENVLRLAPGTLRDTMTDEQRHALRLRR